MFRQRDHQPDRLLGDRRLVHAGCEQHRNPAVRRVLHVDRVQSDAVLRDHLQFARRGKARVDHLRVQRVIAIEQPVEAAIFKQVEHLLLVERATGANDLESAFFEDVVVSAGRVLKTRGAEKNSHGSGG